MEKHKKILDAGKRTIEDYQTGSLKLGEKGYEFRTKEFLDIIYLYINGVTVSDPDILSKLSKNTFVNDAKKTVEKIKEQIRLDLKDINFIVNGASSLGRFIPKAANRKMLKDNNFSVILDEIPDNAADFGSGFLKVWVADGKMKVRSIDPYAMIFNQYNFKEGGKIEKLRKSNRWIIANEKYESAARETLARDTADDDLDKEIVLHQDVRDFADGSQETSVYSQDLELVFFNEKTDEPVVSYFKFDYKKRKGFPDALGIGCYETVFNKLVQSKVNRERLDKVMEIASKLPFQKEMDGARDAYAGKSVVDLDTGVIMGHKGKKLETLNTGGEKQAAMLSNEIITIFNTIGPDLNVSEALEGNTLPSGTSGVLGTLLTENSSSVLLDIKKAYANFLSVVYDERFKEYLLSIYDSAEDLRKNLDANDVKLIEQSVVNFLVIQKQIDAAINNQPFDTASATEEVRQEIKDKPLLSGDLLEQLKNEAEGMETFISGEKISKAQTVAFIREIRNTYSTKPELFKDPFFVQMLKKEAEFEQGISGVEIDNLLKEIQ